MPGDKKKDFGIFKILALLVVLLLAVIIALPFLIDANQFRPKLEAEISGALNREVKVGQLRLSIFSGGVAADDISISDDPAFSKSPFVRAKSLAVGVEMKPLIFSRQVHVARVSPAPARWVPTTRWISKCWRMSTHRGESWAA